MEDIIIEDAWNKLCDINISLQRLGQLKTVQMKNILKDLYNTAFKKD